MFSLRDPYILFLEVILKFKTQSYKSQKKYLDFLLILSHLLNPLSNQRGGGLNEIRFIQPLIQPTGSAVAQW